MCHVCCTCWYTSHPFIFLSAIRVPANVTVNIWWADGQHSARYKSIKKLSLPLQDWHLCLHLFEDQDISYNSLGKYFTQNFIILIISVNAKELYCKLCYDMILSFHMLPLRNTNLCATTPGITAWKMSFFTVYYFRFENKKNLKWECYTYLSFPMILNFIFIL